MAVRKRVSWILDQAIVGYDADVVGLLLSVVGLAIWAEVLRACYIVK